MWTPNDMDIKLADYCIWGVMQQRVYHTPIQDMAELQQRLMSTMWAGFQQSVVVEAIDLWQRDLMPMFMHKVISNSCSEIACFMTALDVLSQ